MGKKVLTRSIQEQLENLGEVTKKLQSDFRYFTIEPEVLPIDPWEDPWSPEYRPVHPWSGASRANLRTCDASLVYLANKLADVMDITVLYGYRDQEEQDIAYQSGNGLPWPKSMHNVQPSMAIDLAPYPVDWDNLERFNLMIGAAMVIIRDAELEIINGRHFTNRADYPHFEKT